MTNVEDKSSLVTVLKFEAYHLDKINLLDIFVGDEDVRERVSEHADADSSICRSIFVGDSLLLGVVGLTMHHKGVASVWSLLDKNVERYPIAYHRTVKNMLNYYFDKLDLHRLQTSCHLSNKKARKQNMKWGLMPEAILRKSGPNGEDELILARVR